MEHTLVQYLQLCYPVSVLMAQATHETLRHSAASGGLLHFSSISGGIHLLLLDLCRHQ